MGENIRKIARLLKEAARELKGMGNPRKAGLYRRAEDIEELDDEWDEWIKAGFTPEEAAQWIERGIDDPEDALRESKYTKDLEDLSQLDELGLKLLKEGKWEEFNQLRAKYNWIPFNLADADLRGIDLVPSHLRDIDMEHGPLDREKREWEATVELWDSNLRGINLEGAQLPCVNLLGADLRYANLRGANLWEASLSWANLEGADLRNANLVGASLAEANLQGADLEGADLRYANLSYADLTGAKIEGADFRGADIYGAKGLEGINIEDLME